MRLASRRFAIALSFPGEFRHRVEPIALLLAQALGRERVFYDCFHEAEHARLNLDLHLQDVYHDHSEIIVVFLCKEYNEKEWCGLEWRAIRDLIKQRQRDIIFVRADTAPIPGVFSHDGYLDLTTHNDHQIAALLLQRAKHTVSLPKETPATPRNDHQLLLKETGTLAHDRSSVYDLLLTEGERIQVTLDAQHELAFALCTAKAYAGWKGTSAVPGSLHQASRTRSMTITPVARAPGKHHVLLINNTRRKQPITFTVAIHGTPGHGATPA